MFYPTNKGRPATARIMQDGTFMRSFARPGEGLPEGEYRVVNFSDIWTEGSIAAAQIYDEKT
jgi:hypothetical protein